MSFKKRKMICFFILFFCNHCVAKKYSSVLDQQVISDLLQAEQKHRVWQEQYKEKYSQCIDQKRLFVGDEYFAKYEKRPLQIISPDNRFLVQLTPRKGAYDLIFTDVKRDKKISIPEFFGKTYYACLEQMFFSHQSKYFFLKASGNYKLYRCKDWSLVFEGEDHDVTCFAISHDENILVLGDEAGLVQFWDSKKNKNFEYVGVKHFVAKKMLFSPQDRYLAIYYKDESGKLPSRVVVYDITKRRVCFTCKGNDSALYFL